MAIQVGQQPRPTHMSLERRWKRLQRGEVLPALLFISPWIIGFLASSLRYSFTEYNMMQPPIPVGFDNFTRLFGEDDLFRKALTNTAIYALFSVPLDLVVALFFALLLNLNIPGRAIFRTAFYLDKVSLETRDSQND